MDKPNGKSFRKLPKRRSRAVDILEHSSQTKKVRGSSTTWHNTPVGSVCGYRTINGADTSHEAQAINERLVLPREDINCTVGIKSQPQSAMSPIEPRDADEAKLENVLTTFPLLKSSNPVAGTSSSSVTVANKPNAIVYPIPRQVIVKDNPPAAAAASGIPRYDFLSNLEAQIERYHGRERQSGNAAESKRNHPGSSLIPKKKLVNFFNISGIIL